VVVTDVTVAGARAEINTAVSAGEDWLNGLSFKVKNVSNKAISFIYVTVMLPETRRITGGTVRALDLRHGTDPKPGTMAPTENLIEVLSLGLAFPRPQEDLPPIYPGKKRRL
jgi:hypothetical protein